jgi:hypothetical protein
VVDPSSQKETPWIAGLHAASVFQGAFPRRPSGRQRFRR